MVKLTDFGLATDSHLTQSVQMQSKVGTPAFMAPEIYEQKPYTASVDVFALGLVFLGLILHEAGQEILMPQIGADCCLLYLFVITSLVVSGSVIVECIIVNVVISSSTFIR